MAWLPGAIHASHQLIHADAGAAAAAAAADVMHSSLVDAPCDQHMAWLPSTAYVMREVGRCSHLETAGLGCQWIGVSKQRQDWGVTAQESTAAAGGEAVACYALNSVIVIMHA
jgi:hypothetical protein